jgi:transcriptional regulator with XRE-family HTH domain
VLRRGPLTPLPEGALRRKPRSWIEWKTLRAWGKLPPWEENPVGYLLREARESAGLTQAELAQRLGRSQQAVAQAERWQSNPTIAFTKRWALATGRVAVLALTNDEGRSLLLTQNAGVAKVVPPRLGVKRKPTRSRRSPVRQTR